MAWFRNHYVCIACDGHWIAEAVEVIEADCPHCRAYDVTAYRSDDLTVIVATQKPQQITQHVTPEASTDKELVAALQATAAKMRGKATPVRSKGRGAARVAVH